jgi:cation diffusion facilitator family transporter
MAHQHDHEQDGEQAPGPAAAAEAAAAGAASGHHDLLSSVPAPQDPGGSESLITVLVAFGVNVLIAVAKTFAAVLTGSASLLAEAAHSWADTGNEIFLLIADRRSRRPPDPAHPFGHGREAYVWSLFAAIGLFVAGAAVSITHGITELITPEAAGHFLVGYAVLALSFILEAGSRSRTDQPGPLVLAGHSTSERSAPGTPGARRVGGRCALHDLRPAGRKGRNLDRDGRCTVAVTADDMHLVLEDCASKVADPVVLESVAGAYRAEYDWPVTVINGAFDAPYGAPTAGPPPYQPYEIRPATILGLVNDPALGPSSTRWRF